MGTENKRRLTFVQELRLWIKEWKAANPDWKNYPDEDFILKIPERKKEEPEYREKFIKELLDLITDLRWLM